MRFLASGVAPGGRGRTLHLGAGHVFISGGADRTDRAVIREVFELGLYLTAYRDAIVVDIGAHKGYFGAYALLKGARRVVSYEPASQNFSRLEQSAASFRGSGRRWDVHRAAVTADGRPVELRLSPESWAHRIVPAAGAVASRAEAIDSVAFADVIASVREETPSGRLIVKVDAEGSECEIVLQTPESVWSLVDELFVETHEFASCSGSDLEDQLGAFGLVVVRHESQVLHAERAAGERPAPR